MATVQIGLLDVEHARVPVRECRATPRRSSSTARDAWLVEAPSVFHCSRSPRPTYDDSW